MHKIEALLSKQVDKTTAKPGDTLNYTLVVKNDSSVELTRVKLVDELAADLEFISQSGELNFRQEGRRLKWKGSIDARSQMVITFRARVALRSVSGTRIINSAQMEASQLQKKIDSNAVQTVVSSDPISTSRIRFTRRAEIRQAEIGRVIRFNVTVGNLSNSALVSPVIEDHLSQGFNFVAGSALLQGSRFTDPRGKRRLTWQLPLIKPGETVVLRYQVVIGADAARGKNVSRSVLQAVDNSGQNILLEDSAFVNVSSDSFIFYSSVDGTVYLDKDGDEFYTPSDAPLEGIEVRMSTGQKAITDREGRFSFESLYPGEYVLGVNRATLPELYKSSYPVPKAVVLSDGLSDTVDFALKYNKVEDPEDSRLEGRVFFDRNRNKRYDAGEPLLKQYEASIGSRFRVRGKSGKFLFSRLKPGSYQLEIKFGGRRYEKTINIKKGNNTFDFPLRYSPIKIVIQGDSK